MNNNPDLDVWLLCCRTECQKSIRVEKVVQVWFVSCLSRALPQIPEKIDSFTAPNLKMNDFILARPGKRKKREGKGRRKKKKK
jgi:hypothetical protein